MTVDEAKEYAMFCIKEGYVDEDTVVNMGDKELIEWAKYNMERGDHYANSKD